MGDAGEGLVDAEAKAAERAAEREEAKRRRADKGRPTIDAAKVRLVKSLELARAELSRQYEASGNALRRQQIQAALADLDKKLAEAAGPRD